MKTLYSISTHTGKSHCISPRLLSVALIWMFMQLSLLAQPVQEYCFGLSDNYVCPEEPVKPDPALFNWITAQYGASPCFDPIEFDNFPGAAKCNGDPIAQNAFFMHQLTFPVGGGNVSSATLRFRAKAAASGQTGTDFIAFFEGATFITGANLWQLPGAAGAWNPNQDATFVLQLGNLPAAFPTSNILSYLQDGDLDVVIGNETGVDWMCIAPSTDSCCADFNTFSNAVENAVSITTDKALRKVSVNIGDLPACDSIAWINWGDGQTANGPFGSGAMAMHTYATNGDYAISMLAEERNAQGQLCFEKIIADTPSVRAAVQYTIQSAECTYYLDGNGQTVAVIWVVHYSCTSSGGTPATAIYHLENALLLPESLPAPGVTLTDSLGNPVVDAIGNTVALSPSNQVKTKIEGITPPPPGFKWIGLRSNELTPSGATIPGSQNFRIAFQWTGLPQGSQKSTGAFWASDDKGDLYGELITDAYTPLDTARLTVSTQTPGQTNGVLLFPNPTSGSLTLAFQGEAPQAGTVQILDVHSKVIHQMNIPDGQRVLPLPVAEWPAGIYLIQVSGGGVPMWEGKVVKQ